MEAAHELGIRSGSRTPACRPSADYKVMLYFFFNIYYLQVFGKRDFKTLVICISDDLLFTKFRITWVEESKKKGE